MGDVLHPSPKYVPGHGQPAGWSLHASPDKRCPVNWAANWVRGGHLHGPQPGRASGGKHSAPGRDGDLLEQLPESRSGYDVDVLLLYDDPADAAREVARLTAAGKTVSAQQEENSPIRYRERLDLRKEAGVC